LEEALKETEALIQRFPTNAAVVQTRFGALAWANDLEGAQRMLDDKRFTDLIDPPAPSRPAPLLLAALKSRSAPDIAALASACVDPEKLSGSAEVVCATGLVALGRTGDAFAMIDRMFPDMRGSSPEEIERKWLEHPNTVILSKILMIPGTAPLREDRRIIAVFERIGLVDFWRSSGKWPDFCETEPKSVCAEIRK
ncbi:MAG: hypothetical protein ABWZ74_04995, partial [Hyphomicrobiaceae bacterium]